MPVVKVKNIMNSTLSIMDEKVAPGGIFKGDVSDDLMKILKKYEGIRISFDVNAEAAPPRLECTTPKQEAENGDGPVEKEIVEGTSEDEVVVEDVVDEVPAPVAPAEDDVQAAEDQLAPEEVQEAVEAEAVAEPAAPVVSAKDKAPAKTSKSPAKKPGASK